jgi:hypothetical protein
MPTPDNVLGVLSLIALVVDPDHLDQIPGGSSCAPTTAAKAACRR